MNLGKFVASKLVGHKEYAAGLMLIPVLRSMILGAWNMTGPVPQYLATSFFPNIQQIKIRGNPLTGSLDESLFEVPRHLSEVDFDGSSLTGSIPTSLYGSQTLRRLVLSNNGLHGTISKSIQNGELWKRFSIMENDLSGTIPTELSSLSNIFLVELRGNELEGTIPSQLGGLRGLLDLQDNNLSGIIPTSLANASYTEVYFGQNKLVGSIPHGLDENTKLQLLSLNDNQLDGTLPSLLPQNVWYIDVRQNNFTSTIPLEWATNPMLIVTRFDDNNLQGPMPLCPENRTALQVSPIALLTATCNPNLTCDCCDTGCVVLSRENGDFVENLDNN